MAEKHCCIIGKISKTEREAREVKKAVRKAKNFILTAFE